MALPWSKQLPKMPALGQRCLWSHADSQAPGWLSSVAATGVALHLSWGKMVSTVCCDSDKGALCPPGCCKLVLVWT